MKVAPLMVLYDGRMVIFDITNNKAEEILKFAETSKSMEVFTLEKQLSMGTLSGDLSLTKRNSLLRFMEKRKERLCCGSENGTKMVPLTILYDGKVADFYISSDKVEDILMFAERSTIRDAISSKKQLFLEALGEDILLARKNSLLRFSKKRKERLCGGSENGTKIMPQSTFCDRALADFDVNDKAEDILNSAERFKISNVFSSKNKLLMETSDLPLAKRNSVVRFLNQRKERICCDPKNDMKVAPLTVLYDGRRVIFDVTNDKAEDILKFAEKSKSMDVFSLEKQLSTGALSGDLSLERRNSLLRFMEKRKERLCCGSENGTKIVLLTILYEGRVVDFYISSDKVEDILMFAEKSKNGDAISSKRELFMEALREDILLARKNSWIRFLEKRKERLCGGSENGTKNMPRSTFCDEAFAVFDVNDKGKNILNSGESFKDRDVFSSKNKLLVETSSGDRPLARRNSMFRFLNQRKERLSCDSENGTKVLPLTITYDGIIATFDVSSDKVEDIIKLAERSKIREVFSSKIQLSTSSGDLSLTRRNSTD